MLPCVLCSKYWQLYVAESIHIVCVDLNLALSCIWTPCRILCHGCKLSTKLSDSDSSWIPSRVGYICDHKEWTDRQWPSFHCHVQHIPMHHVVDRETCSAVHYEPKQPKTLLVLNRGGAGETEADLWYLAQQAADTLPNTQTGRRHPNFRTKHDKTRSWSPRRLSPQILVLTAEALSGDLYNCQFWV